ncbi:MAG: hypothetical protein JWL90_3984 [Chthoniobacteraceae bacterium]|nr:hypothetical protein [Chthoniobacteraceae bacterium]
MRFFHIQAAILLLFAAAPAAEPVVAVEKKETAKPRMTFGAEGEAKFVEFLKKLREAKQKIWIAGVKTEVETMAKATGLDGEAVKALEAAGQKVVESCMDGWVEKIDGLFRRETTQEPEQILEMLDQLLPMVDNYATQDFVADFVAPLDRPSWSEAVQATFNADQSAVWAKVQDERQKSFEKEVGEFLKPQIESTREAKKTEILARIASLKLVVNLSKEALDKLEGLAKTMADEGAETWRKRTEKILQSMGADQRRQILKAGRFYFGTNEEDLAGQKNVWKEAVAKIISPEEFKLWQTGEEEHTSRRTRILGAMTVALLDEKLALNAAQRERLQPILERALQNQPAMFPQTGSEVYFNFSVPMFFAAAASASPEEIKPLLDERQWVHWQEGAEVRRGVVRRAKPVEKPKQPSRPVELEDAENAISEFLHARTATQRKLLLAGVLTQAEDAARVTGLTPDAVGRLQTAARGAVEEVLETWRMNIDQTIHSQLVEVTGQNVVQRLAAIPDYSFQNGDRGEVPRKAMWVNAIKRELNDAQQTAWQKEIDERMRFKEKAICSIILTEFDRKNQLSPQQWEKLEPMVAALVKDYSQDIAGMFSSSDSTPWYLQSYMMFIPFAGIPEADLKAILGKEQWDHWAQSNDFSNSTNYFQNVQQNHKQRVKAVEK